ncbi:MAG TPA: dienelactone hydrolase family protein [Rhizomicrobium sp.]|jgi:dienelactone hydrolase|nr:dienelactone hydrolase family protein [Rhizomicrobium sp.]
MTATLHYVTFAAQQAQPLAVAARLRLPQDGKDKHPAVILLHGSAGPSLREAGYADALNAAGFATLEPDMWAARDFKGGAEGRPRPADALADLYGARALLAAHPAVDAARIGVAGFSFGGVVAMFAATQARNAAFLKGDHFRAFMPVYPAAWAYNRVPGFEFGDLVDAPILLVTGALDQYDNDPEISAKLVAGLAPADRARISLEVMADCHHGFDMPGVDMEVSDPFGNQGKGGKVVMRHNPQATPVAQASAVAFFASALK